MADNSKIEWTDASWNPIRARNRKTGKIGWHCEHATTGCEFCYAEGFNKRLGTGLPFKPGHRSDIEIFLDPVMLKLPLRWKRPRKIFVGSMTDLFADFVTDDMLDQVLAVMTLCPQHTFQVLTKRAERMREYFTKPHSAPNISLWQSGVCWAIDDLVPLRTDASRAARDRTLGGPLPNLWLGVSCERQQEADERIPHLLSTPAAVRFVSAEPLLGPIQFTRFDDRVSGSGAVPRWRNALDGTVAVDHWAFPDRLTNREKIDWIIVGGESGKHARPMHLDWVRQIRDDCAEAGVSFFFKQHGEWSTVYDRDHEDPDWRRCDIVKNKTPRGQWLNINGMQGFHNDRVVRVNRVGKKAAGRLLDGREWNEFPQVRA